MVQGAISTSATTTVMLSRPPAASASFDQLLARLLAVALAAHLLDLGVVDAVGKAVGRQHQPVAMLEREVMDLDLHVTSAHGLRQQVPGAV